MTDPVPEDRIEHDLAAEHEEQRRADVAALAATVRDLRAVAVAARDTWERLVALHLDSVDAGLNASACRLHLALEALRG